jgi:hypothetical protein
MQSEQKLFKKKKEKEKKTVTVKKRKSPGTDLDHWVFHWKQFSTLPMKTFFT